MSEPVWTISWTQTYTNWVPFELPITNFSQAQEVIARIMSL
jgi:hypothetical protein